MRKKFGLSASKKLKTSSGHGVGLNLTPMVDLLTIILVFLIKSYSTTPQYLTPTQDIQLTMTKSETTAPDAPVLIVGKDGILVEGAVVVAFKEGKPSKDFNLKKTLPELSDALKKLVAKAKQEHSHTLILQADKSVAYDTLKPILRTAGVVGFTDIKFAGNYSN